MKKEQKKSLDSENQEKSKMYFNNSILSEWDKKVKIVFQMISEMENINQLRCMQQECKEEGRPHLVAYIDNRIAQLKERLAV